MSRKPWVFGVLSVLITATLITVFLSGGGVKIDIGQTNTKYSINEGGSWKLAATETTSLLTSGGASVSKVSSTLSNRNESGMFVVSRRVDYGSGRTLVDDYFFDSKDSEITHFPAKHLMIVTGCDGCVLRQAVTGLSYSGISRKAISPESFGRIKIEWKDAYDSQIKKLTSSGTLTNKWKVSSDYFVAESRVFDPPISTCGNLSTANTIYTLTSNVASNATCFNITAANVTLDCDGFEINYSANTSSTTVAGYGVFAKDQLGVMIKNCSIVEGKSTVNAKYPVYLINSSDAIIDNNNISSFGGYSYGIYAVTNSHNITISNNKMTGAAAGAYNIYLANSHNSTITNNNLSYLGAQSTDTTIIMLSSSNNNLVSGNKLITNSSGISVRGLLLSASTNNRLYNNTVITPNAMSYYVYGTNSGQFNHSIDTTNLADGLPVNYTINVSDKVYENVDFTSYGQVIFGMSNNVTVRNSKFETDALTFDWLTNSTIENCTINASTGLGIFSTYVNTNLKIANNTIDTSCLSCYGIYHTGNSLYGHITNNKITTSSASAVAIWNTGSSSYNNYTNNNITTRGASGIGLWVYTASENTIIKNNTITTGNLSAQNIYLDANCNHTGVYDNTLNVGGNSGIGVYVTGSISHLIANNTITGTGANSKGIETGGRAHNLTISGNKIYAQPTTGFGILLANSIGNLTITDTIINSSLSANNELVIQAALTSGILNFTNLSRSDGSNVRINFSGNATINYYSYLDVVVRNSSGVGVLANVSLWNASNVSVFSVATGSNGVLAKQTVLAWSRNGTGGLTTKYYTPHSLNVSASDFISYYNSSVNLNRSVLLEPILYYDMSYSSGYPYANKSFRITQFVNKSGTNFTLAGQTYKFLATNSYYLADYGVNHTYDDNGNEINNSRQYVIEVLNKAKYLNINLVRVMASIQCKTNSLTWNVNRTGGHWNCFEREVPGNYSNETFAGLDWVISEASKRDIRVMLVMVNNWNDYGGMRWYVEQAPNSNKTFINVTNSSDDNYWLFHDQFYTNNNTIQWYKDYVNYTLNRNNTFTNVAYKDDPAIFGFMLANEPRAKTDGNATAKMLVNWTSNMSAHFKLIDKKHLITLGIEGWGTPWEGTGIIESHNGTGVDFAMYNLYPDQWEWFAQRSENGTNGSWLNGLSNDETLKFWTNMTNASYNNRYETAYTPAYRPWQRRHSYLDWTRQNLFWARQLNMPVMMGEVGIKSLYPKAIKDVFYTNVIHNFYANGGGGMLLWTLNHDNYYLGTSPQGLMDDGYGYYVSNNAVLSNKSLSVIQAINYSQHDDGGNSWVTLLNNYKYDFVINIVSTKTIDNCSLILNTSNGTRWTGPYNDQTITSVTSGADIIFTKQFNTTDTEFWWQARCCQDSVCTDSTNTLVTLATSTPAITLLKPDDADVSNTGSVKFNYSVESDLEITNCQLYIDGVSNLTDTNVQRDVTMSFSQSFPIVTATRTWQVRCTDIQDNVGRSVTRTFTTNVGMLQVEWYANVTLNGTLWALDYDTTMGGNANASFACGSVPSGSSTLLSSVFGSYALSPSAELGYLGTVTKQQFRILRFPQRTEGVYRTWFMFNDSFDYNRSNVKILFNQTTLLNNSGIQSNVTINVSGLRLYRASRTGGLFNDTRKCLEYPISVT